MPDLKQQGEDLREQYRNRFTEAEQYRKALWAVLCESFFQRHIPTDSTVLDLGCGWGEFISNIKAGTKYAIDLNPDAGDKLGNDVNFINQSCADHWPVAEQSLDVVFTSNFLEHLPDKAAVEASIEQAQRCLKPGGKIICLGPNIRFLPGEYWDFWDHHIPISEHSLAELLELKGFDVEEKHGKFLPYTMSDGNHPNLLLVKLYLKIPLAWKVMGRQFLVIATRSQ